MFNLIDFFLYLAYGILMLNLSLFAISFFKKEKVNGFFLIYLLFATIMQLSLEAFYHLHLNNLLLMNLFFIGQMIVLGLFYSYMTLLKVQKNVIYTIMIASTIAIAMQVILDPGQFFKYNLFVIVLTNLVTIIFAVFHLYNMLSSVKKYYYFTIGLIIYLLASTMVFLVGNINAKLSNEFKFLLWTFNSILLIIYHLFILYEWKVSFKK